MQSNLAASFTTKSVFLVTLAVPVYSFNNQTTTLWKSSNKTDNAVLQCLCLSFLVLAPLNSLVLFSDIDECNAANNSCHENAWCNNTRGSFNCFCKPGHDGDGHNCTGKIICMRLVNECTFSFLKNCDQAIFFFFGGARKHRDIGRTCS